MLSHRQGVSLMKQRPICRHSIFCIVPPHILRQIAINGTPRQRAAALNTLASDQTFRAARITYQLLDRRAHKALTVAAPPTKQRTIYNGQPAQQLPGVVVRNEGAPPTDDAAADEAYDGLGATFDFYLAAYDRNSIDGAMRGRRPDGSGTRRFATHGSGALPPSGSSRSARSLTPIDSTGQTARSRLKAASLPSRALTGP